MSSVHSTTQIEYRPVPELPGYRVGSDGSVWSQWQRKSLGQGNGTKAFIGESWHRLRPGRDRKGYLYVNVRGKNHWVHRLVLLSFVGPCPKGMEACHFPDRNPANCRRENLRWGTKRANSLDRRIHGTERGLLLAGELNRFAKLSDQQVASIRAIGRLKSQRAIAKQFGISCGHVCRILNHTERREVTSV